MCGIAGVYRPDAPATDADARVVGRMNELQALRGPDGAAVERRDRAALGHRRLSIIDLSAAAGQPMASEDGTVWLTFNGEIYNFAELRAELSARGHRFRSRTDGEVLVHGWESWGGPGLLERLRGMFAFALYDAGRQQLLLARDRLGIKPLYYADAGAGGLAFASEVRALVGSGAVDVRPDPDALAGYLLLGSVPSPRTITGAVRCLPPGHYLLAGPGGRELRRYWRLPETAGPPEDLAGRIRRTLEDAVARHLVSDVPLGVFLSGGLDSGALVTLAARVLGPRLHTLTVDFEEPGFGEGEAARALAEAQGAEHHRLAVTAADFLRVLPEFLSAVDQPTHDGLNTFLIARAARKAGLTVVLSGVGGDEVFWGYPHHRRLAGAARPLARLAALPGGVRRAVAAGASAAGRLRGREGWRRLAYLARDPSPAALYLAVRGFFTPDQVERLTGLEASRVRAVLDEAVDGAPAGRSPAEAVNALELDRYLHDQLLRDTDVFGMAHSIEIRVPFLDHPLVELLAGAPPGLKVRGRTNKPLLADAVGDRRLRERARAPKRGFTLPLAVWLRRHADVVEELAGDAGGLDPAAVRAAWRAFRAGRLHWSRAWALAVLGARRVPAA
jgi:asparagine synthase (glutamine-hydrolysing)